MSTEYYIRFKGSKERTGLYVPMDKYQSWMSPMVGTCIYWKRMPVQTQWITEVIEVTYKKPVKILDVNAILDKMDLPVAPVEKQAEVQKAYPEASLLPAGKFPVPGRLFQKEHWGTVEPVRWIEVCEGTPMYGWWWCRVVLPDGLKWWNDATGAYKALTPKLSWQTEMLIACYPPELKEIV